MRTFSRFVDKDKFDLSKGIDSGIARLFLLYIKIIYSSIPGKVVIIFSPIMVALALSVMMPIYMSVGASQIFVTSMSAGVIWGMTYFSIRRTTFYDNLTKTRINTIRVYIAIWLSMLFVTFFSESSYWITTIILDKIELVSLLSNLFEGLSHENFEVNWARVDWLIIIYTWLGSITLMFVACFATRWLFRTEQTFFIVLATYILMLIPFGALVPPSVERLYSDGHSIQLTRHMGLFGFISMLFPEYSLNMFNYAAVWSSIDILDGGALLHHGWGYIQPFQSFVWSKSWEWNYVILYPLVAGFILLCIDILTLYINKV